MIERIKMIMKHYQLTPSGLADTIGVPRSSISHLLTGRNKPSLDFVLKLIKTYPDVNLYWLLNGKGSFPSDSVTEKEDTTPTVEGHTSSLFALAEEQTQKEIIEDSQPLSESKPKKTPNKKIKRIVFFFEDGSFEAYHSN